MSDLISKLISIYRIPLEEKWEEYLTADHMNYFEYMVNLQITDTPDFDINDISTYHLTPNNGLTTYLTKYCTYFDCDQMTGKVVVDVGCGWGFLSFWFLLCGAREVDAIGLSYHIKFVERLRNAAVQRNLLPKDGILRCIDKPLEKGNCIIGGLPKEHADLVAFIDVFEHLTDDIFDDAIIASFNTLKPGGLLVSICHNTDNNTVITRINQYWNQLEETTIKENRRERIAQKIPGIATPQLDKLVLLTRGMMMENLNQAIANFQQNGTFPPAPERTSPAVDLTYDYICENYISPPEVIKKLNQAGFKSYCYPAIRHSRRFMPLWPFEKLFRNLLMTFESLSKTVVFVGKK